VTTDPVSHYDIATSPAMATTVGAFFANP
jgi:hypothetical protein